MRLSLQPPVCSKTKPWAGESCPASFRWYEALSPKPQPLEWPTTLGPTTIAHAIAPEGLAPDTSFPVSRLHPVATVPGVALCLSSLPPPPIDFFYRISQLPCRFALCSFHLSFGLGPVLASALTRCGFLVGVGTWRRYQRHSVGASLAVLLTVRGPNGPRFSRFQRSDAGGVSGGAGWVKFHHFMGHRRGIEHPVG